MKKLILLTCLLFFLFSCGREKSPVSQEKESSSAQEGHGQGELHVSPERQKEWGIALGSADRLDISSAISLPGVLALNQNRTAYISSFAQGKVVSIDTDLGDDVKKEERLLVVHSPEFAQAQASFLEARAKLNLSRREFDRAKRLFEEKAIEEKEYLRREAELEKDSTAYGVLESNLHSFGLDHAKIEELLAKCFSDDVKEDLCELANPNMDIFSPVDGRVIHRDCIVGEHIQPEQILFTVSDLSTLWAILDAYEKDLPYINLMSRVTIFSSLFPEKSFAGKITHISDMVDEKLRTVKVRIDLRNEAYLLKPNMYIQGRVENDAGKAPALAVSDEAVQNLDGEKVVFVLEEENCFIPVPVKIGDKINGKRIISGGLTGDEMIVIKGAFQLKAEMTKETSAHGHVH